MSHVAVSNENLPSFPVSLARGDGIASRGTLSLDAGEVVFVMEAGPTRLAGARRVSRPRAELQGYVRVGVDGPLLLRFADEVWSVQGEHRDEIAARLDDSAAATLLLEGPVRITLGDHAPVAGQLVLTSRRLCFRAEGASADILHVDWAEVKTPRLMGLWQVLSAEVAGTSLRVEGAIAADVAAWLTALQVSARLSTTHRWSPGDLVRWPARRRYGAVSVRGSLWMGPHHLQFVPGGILESTFGIRPTEIPFVDIERVVCRGRGDGRWVIATATDRIPFELDQAEQRFSLLLDRFHQLHQRFTDDRARSRRAVEVVLNRWRSVLPAAQFDGVVEAQHSLQIVGRNDVSVGVLTQCADRVSFFPASGPTGATRAESFAASEMVRRFSGGDAAESQVQFEVRQQSFAYLPAGGAAFVSRFWDRCRAPSRIFRLDDPSSRALRRMLGPSPHIRMRTAESCMGTVAHLRVEGRTWLATLGESATLPEPGQRVTVDIAHPEGVYRFDAEAVDVNPEAAVVSLARPEVVRVYNQRRAFRVAVDVAAQARVAGGLAGGHAVVSDDSVRAPVALAQPVAQPPGAVALKVFDLSLGGCAAVGAGHLPLGADVELELALDASTPLRVSGRVLRVDADDAGVLRRFGFQFADLQGAAEDKLQRHVLSAQRRELHGDFVAAP